MKTWKWQKLELKLMVACNSHQIVTSSDVALDAFRARTGETKEKTLKHDQIH